MVAALPEAERKAIMEFEVISIATLEESWNKLLGYNFNASPIDYEFDLRLSTPELIRELAHANSSQCQDDTTRTS